MAINLLNLEIMKRNILYQFVSLLAFLLMFSSCLKDNVEVIDAFENNNLSDVAGVWYRYITVENENSTREVVRKLELDGITKTVDKETRTVSIKVKPTAGKLSTLPADAKAALKVSNMAVVVVLPTAAVIAPIGDSPALGVNGDWSKPNSYLVKAANGKTAEWTITVTEFVLP